MDTLGSDSFATTQRNAARGDGNTNPRRSLMQQPAVRLSRDGFEWLGARLQNAFDVHGRVPRHVLRELDWPETPSFRLRCRNSHRILSTANCFRCWTPTDAPAGRHVGSSLAICTAMLSVALHRTGCPWLATQCGSFGASMEASRTTSSKQRKAASHRPSKSNSHCSPLRGTHEPHCNPAKTVDKPDLGRKPTMFRCEPRRYRHPGLGPRPPFRPFRQAETAGDGPRSGPGATNRMRRQRLPNDCQSVHSDRTVL